MVKATVAIWAKRDGIRDLVGTAIRQHFYMVHLKERSAIVGEERSWICTRFTQTVRSCQHPSSHPWVTHKGLLANLNFRGPGDARGFSKGPASEQ